MRLYLPAVMFVAVLLMPLIPLCQTVAIKGTIANYAETNTKPVTVARYTTSYYQPVASTVINNNGTFEFKLSVPLQQGAYQLWFDNGDSILFIGGTDAELNFKARRYEGLIIETGFTTSAENKLLWQVKSRLNQLKNFEDSIGHLGIAIDEFDPQYATKSSALKTYHQQGLIDFNKALKQITEAEPNGYCAMAIIPALLKANIAESASGKEFDNNRSFQHYHFFDFINALDTLLATTPFLRQQLFTYMDLWVNQNEKGLQQGVDEVMKKFNLDNELKKYVLTALTDYFTERNNFPLVDYLFSNYYTTCEAPPLLGKSAEIVEQMKRLAPGNKAPDLILPDAEGNYFWLSTMKTRKNVVLYFYASWCQHCQKVTPDVLKYAHEMSAKGVDFVAVSLDSKKEDWLNFIAKNKLDWRNISDLRYWDSEAVKLYALRATPTFYVLDGSLNIIKRTNELEDVKQALTP